MLVSEAIALQMKRSLGEAARASGRDRTAAIMHDIEDYHVTPEQSTERPRLPWTKPAASLSVTRSSNRRVWRTLISNVAAASWRASDYGWPVVSYGRHYDGPRIARRFRAARFWGARSSASALGLRRLLRAVHFEIEPLDAWSFATAARYSAS